MYRLETLEAIARHLREDDPTAHAEIAISGRELRRRLARTISETIRYEPGFSQQSMGPAPARPVLRGMSGKRLLILEDGGQTGDLSATAPDHAVTIEPMNAQQIQVFRGPSALLYTSNTVGGVVNVVRGQVPNSTVDTLRGGLSTQFESVNRGGSGAGNVTGAIGDQLAWRLEGSYRGAADIETPAGMLDNTGIQTYTGSTGFSYVASQGHIGIAGNLYRSEYGIPGGFEGGHEQGVDIEMDRYSFEISGQYRPEMEWVRRHEMKGQYVRYQHTEYEKPERLDERVIGSAFGILMFAGRWDMHHQGMGPSERGVIGIDTKFRNYRGAGVVYTPDTNEYNLSAFTFDEFYFSPFTFRSALRFEMSLMEPLDSKRYVELSYLEDRDIFPAYRYFYGLSASVQAEYQISEHFEAGSTVMRTYRPPTLEELYSDGPHLGAFLFEVGNPELEAERGYSLELHTEYSSNRIRFRAAVFRNQMKNYLFSSNTNKPSIRRSDLNIYRFREERVLLTGLETSYEISLISNIIATGTVSFVRGGVIGASQPMPLVLFSDDYEALPQMPPLSGKNELQYRKNQFAAGIGLRWAAAQTRPGRFEEPTDGFVVFDLNGEYHFQWADMVHTFSLTVENLWNTEHRMHLSRIKEIMPEPGLNIRLLYRNYF